MQDKIQEQIKDAMRARDQVRLLTLRGILAAFTSDMMSKGKKPNEKIEDVDAVAVIKRLIKQRKDSIEQFEKGGRQDLADNEKAELKILEEFLPAQMSEDDVRRVVLKKKEEMEITDKSKMGHLMGAVMKEIGADTDGETVKKIVAEVLQ